MYRIRFGIVIISLFVGAVGEAAAGSIMVDLVSASNNNSYQVNLNYKDAIDGKTYSFAYGYAGVLNWKQTSPSVADAIRTFCIELSQDVFLPSYGNKYDTTADVASTPNPGTYGSTLESGMGSVRANALSKLFTLAYNTVIQNPNDLMKGAAFQLAVWEIVNDYDSSVGHNVNFSDASGGSFKATDSHAANAAVVQASTWLSQLDGVSANYSLVAWTSEKLQDQITIATPEPSTAALLAIGIAGLAGFRLRRPKNG